MQRCKDSPGEQPGCALRLASTPFPIQRGPIPKPDSLLDLAQRGGRHDAAKVLKGFGGAGVLEVVDGDVGGTFRSVYTVKFAQAVFVLHCFQKKSKHGNATPAEDMNIIRSRLKLAEALAKELPHDPSPH